MWRSLTQHHPRIGYTYVPGVKARVTHEAGGYLVRANGAGFRSPHELVAAKPAGVYRVLLFGDSQTAGDGVSNGDRFSELLEKLIPGLEIHNFGLPGSGTDQQYLAWQEFGRGLEHDLLLLAVHVENIGRVNARFRPYTDENGEEVIYAKPYFTLDGADDRANAGAGSGANANKISLHHVPVAPKPFRRAEMSPDDLAQVDGGVRFSGLRKVAKALGVRDLLARVTGVNPVPDFDRADNPKWRLMSAILEEWIAASRAPVLVVPIPLFTFVEEMSDPSGYQARFAELAARTGCRLHDPLPDLRRYDMTTRRTFRFETDVHYTPAGHRAVADSLLPVLRALVKP